eukprot:4861043-Pleurochrysis_carterae.AAC.2
MHGLRNTDNEARKTSDMLHCYHHKRNCRCPLLCACCPPTFHDAQADNDDDLSDHASEQYSQHSEVNNVSDDEEGSALSRFSYRSPESSDDSELEEPPLKPRLQPAPVHESDGRKRGGGKGGRVRGGRGKGGRGKGGGRKGHGKAGEKT